MGAFIEPLELRRLLSVSLTVAGSPTATVGPTINISNAPQLGDAEVASDVDPTNPLHVVSFWNFWLKQSFDGGATWSNADEYQIPSPVPVAGVPATMILRGDPSVAFASDGMLFISFLGQRSI